MLFLLEWFWFLIPHRYCGQSMAFMDGHTHQGFGYGVPLLGMSDFVGTSFPPLFFFLARCFELLISMFSFLLLERCFLAIDKTR
jgi:hypothetical protein